MKKKLLICLLAGSMLLGGICTYASGGDEDSLISVSYLTETFLPALRDRLSQRAVSGTTEVYEQISNRLKTQGTAFMVELSGEDMGNWICSESAEHRGVRRNDEITVSSGSSVFWTAGAAVADRVLIDATTGKEVAVGTRLMEHHRYINGAEESAVTLQVLSDRAFAGLQGYWSLTESGESVTAFTDLIKSEDWFYDAVRYAVEQETFNGITNDKFSPNTTMDRSMLATVLYRMEGSPVQEYQKTFTDVKEGQWYTQGVEWAAANQIVKGMGGDGSTFAPTASVTREQIAAMLFRYANEYLGLNVARQGDLTLYSDYQKVSDWAEESMSWAVGCGIINGTDSGTLLPAKGATRAEVATMLQRFQNWRVS